MADKTSHGLFFSSDDAEVFSDLRNTPLLFIIQIKGSKVNHFPDP
jgi:hypothetical protein